MENKKTTELYNYLDTSSDHVAQMFKANKLRLTVSEREILKTVIEMYNEMIEIDHTMSEAERLKEDLLGIKG